MKRLLIMMLGVTISQTVEAQEAKNTQDTPFQNKERDDGFYEEEHCSVTWRKMCLLSQCT